MLGLTELFQANLKEYNTLKEDYYKKLETEDQVIQSLSIVKTRTIDSKDFESQNLNMSLSKFNQDDNLTITISEKAPQLFRKIR